MNLFQKASQGIASIFARMAKAYVVRAPEGWVNLDAGSYNARGQKEIPAAPREFADEYKKSVWIYNAVRVKAEAIANLPWLLKRVVSGASDEIIAEHPSITLLEHPAEGVTYARMTTRIIMHLELMGNAYLEQIRRGRNSKGEVEETDVGLALVNLDPTRMRMRIDEKSERTGRGVDEYIYKANIEERSLKPKDVVHFDYPDPLDTEAGFAPVQPIYQSSLLDRRARRYTADFMKNGAEPSVVLESDQKIEPTVRTRMAEDWMARHGGAGNAGGVGVLSHGLKVKTLGLSHRDMLYPQLMQMTRTEILAAIRVPPVMVGLGDMNYATAHIQKRIFMEDVAIPLLRYILDTLTWEVVSEFEDGKDLYLEPNMELLKSPEDKQQDRSIAVQAFQLQLVDRTEARSMMGLAPKDEIDAEEPIHGDLYQDPDKKAKPPEDEEAPPPIGVKGGVSVPKKDEKPVPKANETERARPRTQKSYVEIGMNGSRRRYGLDDPIDPEDVELVKVALLDEEAEFEKNCGTGAGGFQEGNTCASGEGQSNKWGKINADNPGGFSPYEPAAGKPNFPSLKFGGSGGMYPEIDKKLGARLVRKLGLKQESKSEHNSKKIDAGRAYKQAIKNDNVEEATKQMNLAHAHGVLYGRESYVENPADKPRQT